jgi:hypothetical protein
MYGDQATGPDDQEAGGTDLERDAGDDAGADAATPAARAVRPGVAGQVRHPDAGTGEDAATTTDGRDTARAGKAGRGTEGDGAADAGRGGAEGAGADTTRAQRTGDGSAAGQDHTGDADAAAARESSGEGTDGEDAAVDIARGGNAGQAADDGGAPLDDEVTIVPGVARYHRRVCILIRFLSDGDLETTTRREAAAAGLVPCKACQPDKANPPA